MDTRLTEIAQKGMNAMKRIGTMNADLHYMLECFGATDAEAERIIDELGSEGLIRRDPGGYNVTSKGMNTSDLNVYFNHLETIRKLKDEDLTLSVKERKRNKILSVGAFVISVISIIIALIALIKSFL